MVNADDAAGVGVAMCGVVDGPTAELCKAETVFKISLGRRRARNAALTLSFLVSQIPSVAGVEDAVGVH